MWSKFRRKIHQWRVIFITPPSVTGLVMIAGSLGVFQFLEWGTLDQFFRLRPLEAPDSRIVIVTIDESDINYLGQWPIPDGVLAQLIEKLKQQQPRAIGLDLYRDVPVEPGHQELIEVFKSTPNLIGAEKAVGKTVPPPPTLQQLDRVGFIDLILDADGKVRRGLLSIRPKNRPTQLSLPVRLALKYLEAEGITLKRLDPKKNQLGLNQAIFLPLTGNQGGYVRANSGGYQVLLNYRGPQQNFYTVSIEDVLENRVAPDTFRDRIVLIGATGQSLNDFFFTPYRYGTFSSPKRVPGVVIHANLTSQLVSAAKDGRPLIQVWEEPIEWLWMLVWSFVGALQSWILLKARGLSASQKWIVFGICLIMTGGSLIAGSYLAFLASWWLPVISPVVALMGSGVTIAAYHTLELQNEKADLEMLLEATSEHYDAIAADLEDKAEEALRESERRLAQILEAMPVGVAVLDATGKPYYANHAAQEILGKGVIPDTTPEQLPEVYQNYIAGTNQLYPYEQLPIVRALRGETSIVDDIEIHQGDKIIPIEGWGTPIYDTAGNLTYAIAAFRDITQRKKAEADRIKLTDELININLAYSRFVPRQFLQLLNKESILDVELGDQVQQEMSVLFSDIRNFTTLSESMTPEDNFKFINAFLSRMEPAISENQGFIDKYIGDAIMALFNNLGADRAVNAGVSMLRRLATYNVERSKWGLPIIQIGIGINTGSMMLGTVGGHTRMDGTVISDAVNLASRLEELTKVYGVCLLISHHTFLALSNPEEHAFRLIDRVKVKGKSKEVTVYEVFDADPPELLKQKLLTKTVFEQALLFYYMGDLPEAAKLFTRCLRVNPEDKVAKIYLQRCEEKGVGGWV